MRRILLLVTPVLVGLLLAPHATASSWWDPWSAPVAGTKARFDMRYGTNTETNAVQVRRSPRSAHPHQVTVRWRTVDGLTPTSAWSQRAWKKIGRGDTVRLTAPVVTCFPTELQVQAVVRVRRAQGWSEPVKLVEHTGARISDC